MLTRRDTLLGLALTSGALAFGLPRFAFARIPTERRFVFIVLRGAMDGLAAVPPYGDPDYRAVRGPLALPAPGQANGILPIDRFYGLNPALQPVAPLFQRGEALALHATEDGWLNRALGLYGAEGRRIGLAVGQDVPLVLRGKTPVQSWAPSPLAGLPHEFIAKLAALYKGDRLFEGALEEGAQAETLAEDVLGSGNRMGPQGPQAGAFAKLAPEAGKLLAAKDGPRVAVMECLGWDTHQAQGTVQGRLADTLKAFAEGVAGLVASLGPAWRDTVVLAASEFGRTAHANGTGGTDHGTATAAFLFGGAVRGGRVAARWPGLSQGRLYQGRDLVPTTDLRAALKAVLRDHLELPGDALDRVVLPNSTQVKPLDGLVRT